MRFQEIQWAKKRFVGSGTFWLGHFRPCFIFAFLCFAPVIQKPALAQDRGACGTSSGEQGVVDCGFNGGSTAQVLAPGSIIILQDRNLTVPIREQSSKGQSYLKDDFQVVSTQSNTSLRSLQTAEPTITVFVESSANFQDQSSTSFEPATDSNRYGVLLGIQAQQSGWSVYAGVDLAQDNVEVGAGTFSAATPIAGAQQRRRDVGLVAGGSVRLADGLIAFGGARAGYIDLETDRGVLIFQENTVLPELEAQVAAEGASHGWSVGAGVGLSYTKAIGAGLSGALSGAVSWSHDSIDGFVERSEAGSVAGSVDPGQAMFVFGDDARTSVVSRVGLELSRPVSMAIGDLTPSIRGAWLHEYADNSRLIDVGAFDFTGFEPLPADVSFRTEEPDRDYFTVGAGLTAALADGRAALALDYEALLGHDFINGHLIRLQLGYRL